MRDDPRERWNESDKVELGNPAHASFSGDYAIANWTPTLVAGGILDGDNIDTSGAPDSIALISDNSATGGGDTLFAINIAGNGTLSFDWSYSSSDIDAPSSNTSNPLKDTFGYMLNGVFTTLTYDDDNDIDPELKSGQVVNLTVALGDFFAFYANSLDGQGGAATTTISNFSAPAAPTPPPSGSVPEPASVWLLLAGLAGYRRVAASRRPA